MITFSKYTEIVNAIATKLKTTKDAANNALIKAQQKGIDPLKWQKNLTILKSFIQIVADYDPSIDERDGTWSDYRNKSVDPKKVTQMNNYWKDLDHMANDERKKKSMKTRFGIKNIKLDKRGNIIYFESIETERDYDKRSKEKR
tara:strand:+ start:181 stop:612 length:432 start_codon:yes stop_codon:yes gene_type:complete